MSGWIKLHRQIWDHWLYQEKRVFSRFEAWIDLILMANHKDTRFALGNEIVEAKRGEVITSELKLMERWGWSKTKLRNFLELCEKDGMIIKKSDRKKTTIIIVNYSDYQDQETTERPQGDREKTTRRPREDTIKNDKNDKNDNNISSSRKKPRFYSEDDRYYKMAVYFHEKVMEVAALNNKEHLVRDASLQKWADEFRKIVELDKRDTKELKQIIDFATSDTFWQTNILSPSKLRKQYVNLAMQMSRPRQHREKKNKVTDNLVFLRSQLEGGDGHEQTGSQFAIDQGISSLPPFRT